MSTIPFTNTTGDGQVPGVNPDATTDYFLITDYNQDKDYFHSKLVELIQFISYDPLNPIQILYGGVVSDAGSGRINISAGAAIGKDASGKERIVSIPSLNNILPPSGWNNDRQIWVVLKYKEILGAANRQHFNGDNYVYQMLDSYVGEGGTDNLFTDSNPMGNDIVLGSFSMNGTAYTDKKERSPIWLNNQNSIKRSIDFSKQVGETFFLDTLKSESFTFDSNSPRNYFPAICLSSIDTYRNLSGTDYESLISHLRNIKASYLTGKSGEVSSWSVTVSSSNITFPNSVSANAILASYFEDYTAGGGSYSNWRTINIAGTDYSITNINLVTRVITVSGTPASGSQTAEFYPHRIAGSSITAREFEVSGKTIISGNDPDGYFISGLRTRDFTQGHWHDILRNIDNLPFSGTSSSGSMIGPDGTSPTAVEYALVAKTLQSDGTNGTPRVRKTTHSPAVSGMLYKWAGAN